MNTAIISFDKKGEVFLINDTAKKLLHVPDLKNVYSLRSSDPLLCEYLTELFPGNNPVLELNRKGEKLKLSKRVSDFTIQGIEHKLISIQNIKNEVEDIELLAWEQLIHVLTHEIMNSMTPISSLSSVLRNKADGLAINKEYFEDLTDLAEGLEVIERRSIGLMDFVNNYKKINTLPEYKLKHTSLNNLFNRLTMLKNEEILNKNIKLIVSIKEELFVNIDTALVEQVLINLINNSIDALQETKEPEIELTAKKVNDRIFISVKDNGNGINEDNLNKIFIPFYTTKKTGSGIGLSFSKQVMRLHNGTISVKSGNDTEFVLEFPVKE